MPNTEIIKYPNPVLLQNAEPVPFGDIELGKCIPIIENMIEAATLNRGFGLAAPQIGISLRIIIYSNKHGFNAIVNPVIISREGHATSHKEQCLSVPGVEKNVRRSRKITVRGFDREGKLLLVKERQKLISFILQHEIDHLNGITLMEK